MQGLSKNQTNLAINNYPPNPTGLIVPVVVVVVVVVSSTVVVVVAVVTTLLRLSSEIAVDLLPDNSD
ncbi:Uncharacterised protein [Weeksella virosa]|uniref:Transmembrane protein n=1 Tax=Weeksella virosa (strain ATCC 43766 / DSM 16922 / JCM 21250 / CCUG 30538 / CDC 9751 / IAM 14551 / NBRC 16016 / NCTC 11634 / CL345/78) TaxID=865938 RepID=F0NY67_WEEVC|nr:hypothetical protein Weevi_0338 [Weeksella virosa DSM 16922]SUP53326.1 Uncharacterised protein [Weeksella virosa]VEH63207.1 Uncharacterised protein [Weeksella virosa]